MHAQPAGGVCCVLGGGNQPTLAVLDVIQAMFHSNAVVCLKYHDAQVRSTRICGTRAGKRVLHALAQAPTHHASSCALNRIDL